MISRFAGVAALAAALLLPAQALAWGYEGHRIVAGIARGLLTPEARARVDAILAADTDPLSGHDMIEEATWADSYRGANHLETAQWHFVDTEIDHPDIKAACKAGPLAAGTPASRGPAEDCVIHKIDEFAAELASPATEPGERLLALKFLLHFVGDVHQPMHASDNHDQGGNCVKIAMGQPKPTSLHSFWDTGFLAPMGADPKPIAATLLATITPAERRAWERGTPRAWAIEAFALARRTAHSLDFPAGCAPDSKPWALPPDYEAAVRTAATLQMRRAGVRLAYLLDRSLQ